MNRKDFIQFILIFIVNIASGRRLCYYPALHMIKLSKPVRRLLFVVDVDGAEISVVGFVWQMMVVFTIVILSVVCLFFSFDTFFEWYNIVSVLEWMCVGIPLAVYSLVSEYVLKKRNSKGSK